MLKLHGFAISNYYNAVKHALLYKGLEFEEVYVRPNQSAEMLEKSPMGKVPFLETEQGILTEANIIMEYLDEAYPENPLYPSDPFAKAKVKQLLKTVELYVEGPAHELVPALMGMELPEDKKENANTVLNRGLPAFQRLAVFDPYVCGKTFSAADIFVYHAIKLSKTLGKVVLKRNIVEEVEGLAELMHLLDETDIAKKVIAENKAALTKL
ncbi:MAG: glutathione S-transferase family protein [Pseudomonadales bacterium]|nr:glutathione S-transferase family protein [Pseudomonadales bacterium]